MTTPNLPNPLETQDSTARQGWTMLLDALPQGVILVDSEGRSLEVNSSAARILHRDRETLLSCSLPDLWSNSSAVDGSAIAVEDLPCVAALRIGTPVHRKTIGWNWEDGSILWLDVAAEPLPGGGALVTFDDTTEHRLQSRKLDRITELYSALSQVNQAIVLSPTKEALLDKICEVMVEFGKFTMAWIGWNDPETHEVRGVSKYGDENGYLDSLQVRSDDTPLGQGGTGTAIREEHTCVVNDFLGSPETSPWLDAASRSGFAASASVPIRKDGKVCGALMVYATEKNYFGSQEIKLLEEAAEDVTFALDNLELAAQRKQTEEALKESEYFFRESQRAAGIGSYKTDFIEGKWESSEVLDNIFGIDRDYRRSIRGWLGIIHPDDQAMMDQYLREEVIAGRKPFSKEYRIIRKSDASTRWMFGHGEVIFDADGNVVSLIGTIQDITERKAAEESLRSSEAKLNLALSSAEMGVWTWDIQKNLRQFDDRVCQLLGIDKDTFAGSEEEFLQVVSPEDYEGIKSAWRKTIDENLPYEVEYGVRWRDGSNHVVSARGRLIRDEQGQPLQILGILWDITEQKRNVAGLMETMQRLKLATTSASMGVWDWDLQTGSMTWDHRMFELYGATHGEIQGTVQVWKDGLHPEDLDRAIAECEAAIRGEAPFDTEFRVKHKNGTILWIKANAAVLRDQRGNAIRMVGLNQDMTENREVQEQIRRLNRDLEERVSERTTQLENANKEMEAFSYSVSHDLRAPLRSIDGFSQVLLDDYSNQVDEAARHYLSRIRFGAQRMGQIIDDLLRMSRIERTELNPVDLDLSDLCGTVLDNLILAHPGRRMEVSIQPGIIVKADHRLIQVVLENLLGNAWKFTSKREDPRIEVGETAASEEGKVFFIRDNGAGFDMAFAHKLFNAFQRLHATSEFEGTGIGLAIVQRIIQRHGGRIWAESGIERGATFLFTLPD